TTRNTADASSPTVSRLRTGWRAALRTASRPSDGTAPAVAPCERRSQSQTAVSPAVSSRAPLPKKLMAWASWSRTTIPRHEPPTRPAQAAAEHPPAPDHPPPRRPRVARLGRLPGQQGARRDPGERTRRPDDGQEADQQGPRVAVQQARCGDV